jgi:serine phosphatase RsbU (regulator of sigma subunit)
MSKPLLFILSIISISILSQNTQIDSIKNILKDQQDTTLVKSLHQLTLQYEKIEDYKNAALFNNKAQAQLEITPDTNLYIFVSNYTGIIHLKQNEVDSAFIVYNKLLDFIGDSPNHVKYTIAAYGNRSLCFKKKSLPHKALEDLILALETAKKHEQKKYIGILYDAIALVFHDQEEYEKAIEYHFEAIHVKKELKNQHSLAISYENIALSFSKKNQFNKAFEYFEKSRKIFDRVDDQVGLALCNHYSAKTYHKLFKQEYTSKIKETYVKNNQSFLDSALIMNRKALSQLQEINNVFYTTEVEIEYAKMLFSARRYNEAKLILNKLKIELKDEYNAEESSVYKQLYEISKVMNNYNDALKFHEQYLIIKDSLVNKKNLKELGRKQAELAFNKEQELTQLKRDNKIRSINFEHEKEQIIEENNRNKQTYIIVAISICLITIIFLLLIMLRRWKITKAQKETINLQKELIGKEKQTTLDSINYAKNIQKAAFSSKKEVKQVIPNHFILFKPKDIVSGDFYWTHKTGNKRFVALADCTGHGVPGAFMTLISLNILNQIISDGYDTPSTILEQLHTRLQKKLKTEDGKSSKHGLDIAVCMIEKDKLTYSGIHLPIYHVRNQVLTEYKGQRFQLGSNDSTLFQQHEILLQKEDAFYISTDGFPDQKGGPKGKKYYYPTLRNKLLSLVHLDLEEQRLDLESELMAWKGEKEQLDDVSIIGFKI